MTAVGESRAGVSASEFRQAMGHFATGVTVVTSVGDDGEPVGTTASAVTSLSLNPPLVLVCFDQTSLTLNAIRTHGAFVVNMLAAPQQHLSANFARRGLAAAWDGVRHRPGPTGSPRLDGVLAVLECTVENRFPGGDHEIVIGRVHHAEVSDDDAPPLLYWRGSYLSLGGDMSALPGDAAGYQRPWWTTSPSDRRLGLAMGRSGRSAG
jgi:flavin reductase (DIM6/NTAB) family NADH-FMN oxidoreductase RutF